MENLTLNQFKEVLDTAKAKLSSSEFKAYGEEVNNLISAIDELDRQAVVKRGDIDSIKPKIRIPELKYGQGNLKNDELAGKFYIPQIGKDIEEAHILGKDVKVIPVKFTQAVLVGNKINKDFRRVFYGSFVKQVNLRKYFPKEEGYWILGLWPADQAGYALFGITADFKHFFKITGAKNVNDKNEGQREELKNLYENLRKKDIEFQQNVLNLKTKQFKSKANTNTKVISFDVVEEKPSLNPLDDIVYEIILAYENYLVGEQIESLKFFEQKPDDLAISASSEKQPETELEPEGF